MNKRFLLYGANGYTAQLIIPLAVAEGYEVTLAGRTKDSVKEIADQYKLSFHAFSLENQIALDQALKYVPLVLHCAGPYKYTAQPMIEACIRTNTHYLDITGELGVFALAHSFDKAAKETGVLLLPGTGFDIVPTDCLAAFLKTLLPDANYLELGFATTGGSVSRGTALTSVEYLGERGAIRENGVIKSVPVGSHSRMLNFGGELTSHGVSIPWGDVFTAYHTTGIPNVKVYIGLPKKNARLMKIQSAFRWLLSMSFVKNYIRRRILFSSKGPDKTMRAKSQSFIWGEVTNSHGKKAAAYLKAPNGYSLTAFMAFHIAKKVLNGEFKAGFQTPAGLYGHDLILEMEGVSRKVFNA
ncbi:MAG: NAD(P)H-binding protein [Bacteroidetes bacterium]|nr:NAD(P)H-binding protein [Bacteroidota bacterium]